MKVGAPGSFGAQLKALREGAGFTQEELATIAGLSVHAVSALERGERRRPQTETVRALSAALDLAGATRDALVVSARAPADDSAALGDLSGGSLPLAPTVLLGRESDVHTLRQWLADSSARLITLVGTGGVGKTRLALEVARAVADEGSTRVVLLSLASIRDAAFVAPAIAEALGMGDVSAGDLPRRARGACSGRPTLLILDNFEQVLSAAQLVADLLTSVDALRVLVTSRAPLRVRGEREYAVGPLALDAGSEKLPPTDLERTPAVRLFVERVRDVQPDFCVTAANGPTVTAICRRLDALPLALELVAPWLKVLSADDLLRRLSDDVLLSTVGARDLPERQQTMNATVAWSYHLLEPEEQFAFRRLGALPCLFPIDAAAAVLAGNETASAPYDAALSVAASLIDKSLLLRAETSVVPTCSLYYMLDTVRAYAARELAASGERDDALEGLVRYTRGEAALAAEGLVGPAQVEWLDRVREDLESYRDALAWLIEKGRPVEASEIACGLMFFWMIRGRAAEGLGWYEQILDLPLVPAASETGLRVGAAAMLYTRGEIDRARSELTRALQLAHDSRDIRTIALADDLLAHVDHAAGDLDAARDRFTRSLESFRDLTIPWATGDALSGLAEVALATGDATRAEQLLDEAALTLRQAGPWFMLLPLYVRAILAVRRGNAGRAIALVREGLIRIRELRDKFAFVYMLVPLVAAAALEGEDAWVARILGARDAVAERSGASVAANWVDDLTGRAERDARARLGADRWAEAYAAGRNTSLATLLKDIDNLPPSPRSGIFEGV
jgi:predicted ATPase/transcriptional regulator with XRE-family HTH domain